MSTSPPQIATYNKAIKVTVDGPREPRSKTRQTFHHFPFGPRTFAPDPLGAGLPFKLTGIAHHLASLPGHHPEWAMLGRHHPYPGAPFVPPHNHHPPHHFPPHMFAAALTERPNVSTSPRLANEPSSTSLGPISINCTTSAHSTTSPKSSPPTTVGLLTTAPLSPRSANDDGDDEDDISVTASPTPSPQPPPAFPGVAPPLHNQHHHHHQQHQHHLFNNALAASLFLNAPLLPPPSQWSLYSQFYPHELSTWMNLRNHHSLVRQPPPPPATAPSSPQNHPDSSGNIDVEESSSPKINNNNSNNNNNNNSKELEMEKKCNVKNKTKKDEGVNLTVSNKGRKQANNVTLIKELEVVVSSSESNNQRNAASRQIDVWRPY